MDKKAKKYRRKEEKAGKPAVLFSLDGTVLDTEPAILAAYRHVFSLYRKNFRMTPQIELEVLDEAVPAVMKKYLPKQDPSRMTEEFTDYQRNHLIDLIQPEKDIETFLKWIRARGYKTGVISTRERSVMMELLEHTHLVSYFDTVLGSSAHSEQNHIDSDQIILACRLLGVKNAIYIGDCAADIAAGQAAGAYTIGYAADEQKTTSIAEQMPDFMTGDLGQMIKLMKGEPLWLAYRVYQPEEIQAMEEAAEKRRMKEEEKAKKKAEKKQKKDKKKEQKNKKKQEAEMTDTGVQ